MFPFNFITYEAADDLLPLANEHDVGFISMKPLEGGRLDNISLAFKYLLQFPNIVIVVGIEKIQEIEEIAEKLKQPLTFGATEEAEVYKLRQELDRIFCRRCDYCQPCIADIPISLVM
ncbi:unnamed protein product, partial [marine sediment metagenome]